jgi:hypothetical protein
MMKANLGRILSAVGIAVGLTLVSGAAHAQGTTTDAVVVRSPKPSTKRLKFKGTVLSANIASINLRDQNRPTVVQAFSYSTDVRNQMVKILNAGGYQPGDKVTVEYAPGTTVALKLHGNPSKPKHF